MAKLQILGGPDTGRKYEISEGRLIVGRGDECDVRINEGSISRHHAALECVEGAWYVEDLKSANGVFVNGAQVSRLQVSGRNTIQFGSVGTVFDTAVNEDTLSITAESAGQAAAEDAADARRGGTAQVDAGWMQGRALDGETITDIREMGGIYGQIESEFGRAIVGQKRVLEELLVAIAAGGHCLMIGLPGLGKTLMVNTLAKVLRLQFKRIQFTPDLMPSDIIGTDVLEVNEDTGQKTFRFIKGPIFANMLLADEINRTPPKTQAALLEAMQERQVTVANHVFPLPPPFFVLATQNPLEQEGTYPLPEAQLDRFMFNIIVDYPDADEEERIVTATTGKQDTELREVLTAANLLALQRTVRQMPVSPHVVKYATRLVRMTRPKAEDAPQFIKDNVHCGAGPRAAQFLILGAKARAVLHGRLNVSCEDIRTLALPVMRHRIFTNFTADSEGIGPDDLVKQLLAAVPEPSEKDYG
jgi:MoxR-like ATPase